MRNYLGRKLVALLNKEEEGFTLVELLAVLVILALIVAIAVPAIGGVIDGAEADASAAEKELVEDAARLYDIKNDITGGLVKVSTLVDEGFLEDDDVTADTTAAVIVTVDGDKVTYEYSSNGTTADSE